MIGKTRRIRRLLTEATDHASAAGFELAKRPAVQVRIEFGSGEPGSRVSDPRSLVRERLPPSHVVWLAGG